MNKKDIAAIRKQFKLDTDLLMITDIYNVYVRQESDEIYHEESQAFGLMEREQQELFLANFKKVLGGKLDMKLFEVRFAEPKEEQSDNTQRLLYAGLNTREVEDWKENMQGIAQKMVQSAQYEKDLVITFIRGKYYKPTKKNLEELEMAEGDEAYTTPFILCSMNYTELPKPSLIFDFIEREFKSSEMADPVVKLASPIGGFLFPCFTDNAADVNHILYAAGKANKPDYQFIENVLDGEEIMTAEDDKAVFEEIVKHVVGDEVNTQMLTSVYDEINRMNTVEEEGEDEEYIPTLDTKELERVLKMSGAEDVDTEKVQQAFQSVVDDESYELKARHVVPSYTSKSIKISTKVANIAISPQDLKYVKQVNYNGKRCILIEVEEDTMIEGFTLMEEELFES
ncbi:DUF4317 domain-containing protein [Sporosarcina jeotgali]|uniref:DUF4317 domain-containing protein n=1 Tax=Sporosarcina jeotgali TaxID=3020056 RepID=A0ABZ0KXJ1_9BACL|nr:DUF4317 domain-containing protein [Sporosarcina sp. B2O-1]WOV84313.1 DUF4317 domain-containing protein [Sporosarcina sp. B2O-1]